MRSAWTAAYFRVSTNRCKSYHSVALVATKYLIITSGNGGRGVDFVTASGTPKAKPAPSEEPGMEPPDSIDADPVGHRLQEDLFQSLVESADYTDGRTPLPARSGGALQLATPEAILGARTNVILTHTAYNRARGPEETKRFLEILLKGIDPFREYARRHKLAIHLWGIREGYELEDAFNRAFASPAQPEFDAHFLMDYEEEWFLTPEGRGLLELMPEIDVAVRHTKLGISGGWIPTRMRKAAYVYSQNGSVHSNWNFTEYAAMVAVAYLAKLLHQGESLSKTYASIDEIKARYRDREIRLRQKVVRLAPKPRKLFVLGSPVGLIQVYA